MSDLIERQAAIDAVENIDCFDGIGISALKCEAVDDAVMAIKALSSAQQEIIRCKDCLMHGVCRFEQGLGLDGYCSQAERRR